MTWTYLPTDISTDLAKTRLLIGDTNTDDQLLTDEEINFHLSQHGSLYLAAADCCDSIVGRLARDIDRSNLGMSAQRSQKVQHYRDLAASLRARGKRSSSIVPTLPATESDKANYASDTTLSQPRFTRDMFSNPRH